jgi:eukaryotic-like serine/threonine-protein kinase
MADPIDRLKAVLADRYTIERELGAGGMATVYLALDVRHNRRVALKVLRSELAVFIGAERFLKEIETTANLQHPHILPLFDSGRVDSTVFYVMPYVEGESLGNRLARETQLERFLMLKRPPERIRPRINVVLNRFDELRAKAPR